MARHRWDARLAALAATKVGLFDSLLLHEGREAGRALLFPRQILFSIDGSAAREAFLKAPMRPNLLKRFASCDRRRVEGIEEH
jgi:hypothetical protein